MSIALLLLLQIGSISQDSAFAQSTVSIRLRSDTSDDNYGLGVIKFDGTSYSLPTTIQKEVRNYRAEAFPPDGYVFKEWQGIGGNIFIESPTSATSIVSISSGSSVILEMELMVSATPEPSPQPATPPAQTTLDLDICVQTGEGWDCNASTIQKNTNIDVAINGMLMRTDNQDSISGKTINLAWPGGRGSVTTENNGGFSYTTTVYVTELATFTASFQGDGQYASSFNSKTLTGVEPPQLDPELISSYISPAVVESGDPFRGFYTIKNPNSAAVSVWLGLSIRPNGSIQEISDPNNDREAILPSGLNEVGREFLVGSSLEPGEYDVTLSMWQERPVPGVKQYDTSGWQIGVLTVEGITPPPLPTQPTVQIRLRSDTSDDNFGLGSIKFDGTSYLLPATIEKIPGNYRVEANPPEGFIFSEWQPVGSNILIESMSLTAQSTIVSVSSGNSVILEMELTPTAPPPQLEIDAEISSLSIDGGAFSKGDFVSATIVVENTGNVDHTFYVGYSVMDQNGKWYDAPWTSLTIKKEQTRTTTQHWTVLSSAGQGTYLARVAVYESRSGSLLENRLDYKEKQNAFTIELENSSIDSDRDSIPDISDACPSEAETFNKYLDSDGCPDRRPMESIDITISELLENYKTNPSNWRDKQVRIQAFVAHGYSGKQVSDFILPILEFGTWIVGLDDYFRTEGIRYSFELSTFYLVVGDSRDEKYPYPWLPITSYPVPLTEISNDDLGTFVDITGRLKEQVGQGGDTPPKYWFEPDVGGVVIRPQAANFVSLPDLVKNSAYEGKQISTYGQVIERKIENGGMIRLLVNLNSLWVVVPDADHAPKLGSFASVEGSIVGGKMIATTVKTRTDTIEPITKNEGCTSLGNPEAGGNIQNCTNDGRSTNVSIDETRSANISIDESRSQLALVIADNALVDTSVDLFIANDGSTAVTKVGNDISGSASSWVKQKPGDLTVNPGKSTTATFLVNPPDGTRPGSYTLNVKFIGEDDHSGTDIFTEAALTFDVPTRADFSASEQQVCTSWYIPFTEIRIWDWCEDLSKTNIVVGEIIYVKVNVNNLGNVPVSSIQGTITSVPDGIEVITQTKTSTDLNELGDKSTLEWRLKAKDRSSGFIHISVTSNIGERVNSVKIAVN